MLLDSFIKSPVETLLYLVALVISITIHEFAHAFAADRLGDPTPKLQDRYTLNPLSHLDPIGVIAFLLTGFGWGKPVEYDPYNLPHPRRDAGIIALAGPATNIFMAILCALLARFVFFSPLSILSLLLGPLVWVNVGLAIFNLIPIHPLDGGKILIGFAPRSVAHEWQEVLDHNGFIILIALLLPLLNGTSAVSFIIGPIVSTITRFLWPW